MKKLFLILVYFVPLLGADNQLQKLYLHQNDVSKSMSASCVELGKLVFYFSQEPIITVLPDLHTKTNEPRSKVTFLLPKTTIGSEEARQMVARCNKTKNPYFTIALKAVTQPIEGLQLIITYDPSKILYKYHSFESIKTQNGLVFTFYNKQLLDLLKSKNDSILHTACNDVPKIIIDCGHGGQDTGAKGCATTVEKDLTRTLGQQLSQVLKKKGYTVVMTRKSDEFVELDKRTLIANKARPDLLISIHANYSTNPKAAGIETYYYDTKLLRTLHSDSYDSVIKMMSDNLANLSKELAQSVHKEVVANTRTKANTADRKVKTAVSQMLIGSTMPAILLEVGFISNPQEAELLKDPEYQRLVVEGMSQGIAQFLSKIKC